MVSPRTRKVPRVKAMSLRVYWMSTRRRSSLSRSISSPTLQLDRSGPRTPAGCPGRRCRRRWRPRSTSRRVSSDIGRGVAQPLDLLVDRGVLLDVGVRLRDVRLGLVVVVVGDEVLDRVVRQQLAELVGQLGGEGLVRRHHQGGALQLLDQPGGGRATCRCRWRRAGRRPSRRPGRAAPARRWPPAGRRWAGSR